MKIWMTYKGEHVPIIPTVISAVLNTGFVMTGLNFYMLDRPGLAFLCFIGAFL